MCVCFLGSSLEQLLQIYDTFGMSQRKESHGNPLNKMVFAGSTDHSFGGRFLFTERPYDCTQTNFVYGLV